MSDDRTEDEPVIDESGALDELGESVREEPIEGGGEITLDNADRGDAP